MRCIIKRTGTWLALLLCGLAAVEESALGSARTAVPMTADAIVLSSRDVRFKIVIDNGRVPCSPFYVDRTLSAFLLANRPRAQLLLVLRDHKGNQLTPPRKPNAGVALGARPEELLLIDCGMVFGRYIHITQFGWANLPRGTYVAELTLIADTRAFVDSRPGYVEALVRISGSTRSSVLKRLINVEARAIAKFAIN
jgi:hypothetical protein